jgi:hypothetical protein
MKILTVSFLVLMGVVALGVGFFFRSALRDLDDLSKWGDSDD